MVPGWSPETASSLALAPPRRVPRHRDLRGRRPGHDPLRREGRGSYQPRSDPLPLRSRRFKHLSAVPSAPTWRLGPRRCVLERPRTPRRAPRTPVAAPATPAMAHAHAQSLTGAVVPGAPPQHLASPGKQGCAPGSGRVKAVWDVCPDLPSICSLAISSSPGLRRLPRHLQGPSALMPVLEDPCTAGSVVGELLCRVPRGRLPGWRGSRDRNSGISVLSCPAPRVPSADLWFLRLPVWSLQPASLLLAGLVFVTAVKIRLKCPAASPPGSKGRTSRSSHAANAESCSRVTLGHVRGVCPRSILLALFVGTCDRPSHQLPMTLSPFLSA